MVDRTDPLPVSRQCKLLDHQRLTFYGQSKAVPGADLALMRTMGLTALYPKRNLSKRNQTLKVCTYLLRGLVMDQPNQVWAADETLIPMTKGLPCLVAIIDCYSRKVLAWKISNSIDARFCVEALETAIGRYGRPEIFKTDQGSLHWRAQSE
jgi:putative transposase